MQRSGMKSYKKKGASGGVSKSSSSKRSAAVSRARNMGTGPQRSGYAPNYGRSGEEKKNVDTLISAAFAVTTSINLLNGITQGTDSDQRIGRKCKFHSVYIRGSMTNANAGSATPAAAVIPAHQVRMILVWDGQPNAAAPGITDILVSDSPNSQLNLNNRQRFKVLKDKVWTVGPAEVTTGGVQGTGPVSFNVKIFKKIMADTQYGGTANSIGSIQTGALWLVLTSNAAADAASLTPALNCRVRYTDV